MKLYIKSNSNSGYLYIFKHGVGPGTLPKDVQVVRTKDLPRGYTAVWTDRFLTTSEMDEFDIPYETEINRYLDRIGYCQKNGDVVPCEDVDACDNITASDICYRDRDNDDRVVALDAGMSDEDVEKLLAEHPSYYRSTLDSFDDVDACTEVMAASNNTTKFSDELVQKIRDEGFGYIIDNSMDSLDTSIVEAILYSAIYSKNPDYLLYLIDQDEYHSIRLAQNLGINPNAPAEVLEAIWAEYSDTHESVVWKVVRNSNVPKNILEEALNSPFRSIRAIAEDKLNNNDVNACDEITASDHRYSAGRIEDDGTEDFYYDTGFDSWDEACDWGINHECTHIYDREKDEFVPIESCDTKYFANMVSASDNSNYFKYRVCGYYDADKRGLAESEDVDDTQLVNAWANEYANKGYYITIEDRESGSIMEFSPDEWFEYWYMA